MDTGQFPFIIGSRSLIRVRGAEAEEFLQAIITADVGALPARALRPAALLSPQGKILFDFLIARADESGAFLIDIAADLAEGFVRRLSLYKLRRAAEISAPAPAAALISAAETGNARRDMRFPDSCPVWRSCQNGAARTENQREWDRLRLAFCLPESGRDFPLGEVFPHDVNYDALGAVSFSKGCYIGQEVVSRMRHKAVIRKRLLRAETLSGAPLPQRQGTEIAANGKVLGQLGAASGGQALALIRLDRLAKAGGKAEAAGAALHFSAPFYLPEAALSKHQ